MTTGGPIGERPVTASELLELCDRALGEVSRRRHLFGWLRAPGAEEWLAVDAYYPGHRLIVLCRDEAQATVQLIAERAPEHGLRLLRLDPEGLGSDPAGIEHALHRRLAELGPPPARPQAAANGASGPVARTVAGLAHREPAPHPRTSPARRPATAPQQQAIARATEFVSAHREQIDENAHSAAVSRHREPIRAPRREPLRRRNNGPSAARADAAGPAARRHPAIAAALIAGLIIVVVVAIAIVTAAHGG